MAGEDAGKEMTFWDHLDELRGTILRSLAAVSVCAVLGLIFRVFLFDGIILPPTRPDFLVYRLLGWDFTMQLINVELSAQFFAHLKAAFAAGLVVAFPYVVFELWRFVAPALYAREKGPVRMAFCLSTGLFYLGVAAGYFIVLPFCLRFFLSYTVSDAVANTITLGSYMSMFFSMVLLIGIAFEFPTVVMALGRLGVVSRRVLRKGRKYAIVLVLVLAALITPADPFSMFVLAVPLYLLYELSILLCSKSAEKPEMEE